MKNIYPFLTQGLKAVFQAGINKIFSVYGGSEGLLTYSHLSNFFQLCLAPVNTFYNQSLLHYYGQNDQNINKYNGFVLSVATLTSYVIALIAILLRSVLFSSFNGSLILIIIPLSILVFPLYTLLTVLETKLIFDKNFKLQFYGYLFNTIVTGLIVLGLATYNWFYGLVLFFGVRVVVLLIVFFRGKSIISLSFKKHFTVFFKSVRPYIGISLLVVLLSQSILLIERNIVVKYTSLLDSGAWQAAYTGGFYIQLIALTLYNSFYIPEISRKNDDGLRRYIFESFYKMLILLIILGLVFSTFSYYLHKLLFSSEIEFRSEVYTIFITGFVFRALSQIFTLYFLRMKIWKSYLFVLFFVSGTYIFGLLYLISVSFSVKDIALLFLAACVFQFILAIGLYFYRIVFQRNV
ncbi:MATE family efflux transporter [Marinigracilibium pacificum]|uniref:O-antigen/teichoic acid export membrane protein n=1 Tax=Marinigracilibium pacificum TaxID=2729599 RepID=A0A848IZC6_9BACT|nr:hypothetical protein [Marinigracilibium pacificum]NMM48635.1 hypothetical protein [Marinigracilibium pacificum]